MEVRHLQNGNTYIKVEPENETQRAVCAVCDDVKAMLIDKNRKYGDSALTPLRIFSKADAVEAIKVRIDDKLSRLHNEVKDDDEDVIMDLIGYLVLLKIAKERQATSSQ